MKPCFTQQRLAAFTLGLLLCAISIAAPVLQQHSLKIDGKERRYYHLTDTDATSPGQPIILVSGSGCDDPPAAVFCAIS